MRRSLILVLTCLASTTTGITDAIPAEPGAAGSGSEEGAPTENQWRIADIESRTGWNGHSAFRGDATTPWDLYQLARLYEKEALTRKDRDTTAADPCTGDLPVSERQATPWYQRATNVLQYLLRTYPGFPEAQAARAFRASVLLVELEQPAAAAVDFEAYLTSNPFGPQAASARYHLGNILFTEVWDKHQAEADKAALEIHAKDHDNDPCLTRVRKDAVRRLDAHPDRTHPDWEEAHLDRALERLLAAAYSGDPAVSSTAAGLAVSILEYKGRFREAILLQEWLVRSRNPGELFAHETSVHSGPFPQSSTPFTLHLEEPLQTLVRLDFQDRGLIDACDRYEQLVAIWKEPALAPSLCLLLARTYRENHSDAPARTILRHIRSRFAETPEAFIAQVEEMELDADFQRDRLVADLQALSLLATRGKARFLMTHPMLAEATQALVEERFVHHASRLLQEARKALGDDWETTAACPPEVEKVLSDVESLYAIFSRAWPSAPESATMDAIAAWAARYQGNLPLAYRRFWSLAEREARLTSDRGIPKEAHSAAPQAALATAHRDHAFMAMSTAERWSGWTDIAAPPTKRLPLETASQALFVSTTTYLTLWPQDPASPRASYVRALLLFNHGHWREAFDAAVQSLELPLSPKEARAACFLLVDAASQGQLWEPVVSKVPNLLTGLTSRPLEDRDVVLARVQDSLEQAAFEIVLRDHFLGDDAIAGLSRQEPGTLRAHAEAFLLFSDRYPKAEDAPEAMAHAARLQFHAGDMGASIATRQRLRSNWPDWPGLPEQVFQLAETYLRLTRFDEACAGYVDAAKAFPGVRDQAPMATRTVWDEHEVTADLNAARILSALGRPCGSAGAAVPAGERRPAAQREIETLIENARTRDLGRETLLDALETLAKSRRRVGDSTGSLAAWQEIAALPPCDRTGCDDLIILATAMLVEAKAASSPDSAREMLEQLRRVTLTWRKTKARFSQDTLDAIGRAYFSVADGLRRSWQPPELEGSNATLERRTRLLWNGLSDLRTPYADTIALGTPPWTAAALIGQAELSLQLADILRKSPPPEGLDENQSWLYLMGLSDLARRAEADAQEMLDATMKEVRGTHRYSRAILEAEAMLRIKPALADGDLGRKQPLEPRWSTQAPATPTIPQIVERLADEPDNVPLLLLLARRHAEAGDRPLATLMLETIAARLETPGTTIPVDLRTTAHQARLLNDLGVLAWLDGRTDEASARWLQAVELDPQNENCHYNIGHLALKAGDYEFARTHLDAVAASLTERSDRLALASARRAGGDPGGAVAVYDALLAVASANPNPLLQRDMEVVAEKVLTMAFFLDDMDGARAVGRSHVERYPGDRPVVKVLADIEAILQERAERAREEQEQAERLASELARAKFILEDVQKRLRACTSLNGADRTTLQDAVDVAQDNLLALDHSKNTIDLGTIVEVLETADLVTETLEERCPSP